MRGQLWCPEPHGEPTRVSPFTGRYMDPITKDTFSNKSVLVALKPTGDVILEATYKKLVKPEGNFNGVRPAVACP